MFRFMSIAEGAGQKEDLPRRFQNHTEHEVREGREQVLAFYLQLHFNHHQLLVLQFKLII
jgi:hypothetical protein